MGPNIDPVAGAAEVSQRAMVGGSRESSLDKWSTFHSVVGVVGLAVGVVALVTFALQGAVGSGLIALFVCASVGFANFFMSAVLSGEADIIRLLKKLNDEPFK